MAVFVMMSLLTELGVLTERFFYKYSAPHGAYGAKLARGAAQERRGSRFEPGAFQGFQSVAARAFRAEVPKAAGRACAAAPPPRAVRRAPHPPRPSPGLAPAPHSP